MVFKVIHCRAFAGQDGQFARHEVPEAEARRVKILSPPAYKIHRNVEGVVDILLKTKPVLEHEGEHTRPVGVGVRPNMRPVA